MKGEQYAMNLYEALRRKDLVGGQRSWAELDAWEREDWVAVAMTAGTVALNRLAWWPVESDLEERVA